MTQGRGFSHIRLIGHWLEKRPAARDHQGRKSRQVVPLPAAFLPRCCFFHSSSPSSSADAVAFGTRYSSGGSDRYLRVVGLPWLTSRLRRRNSARCSRVFTSSAWATPLPKVWPTTVVGALLTPPVMGER